MGNFIDLDIGFLFISLLKINYLLSIWYLLTKWWNNSVFKLLNTKYHIIQVFDNLLVETSVLFLLKAAIFLKFMILFVNIFLYKKNHIYNIQLAKYIYSQFF